MYLKRKPMALAISAILSATTSLHALAQSADGTPANPDSKQTTTVVVTGSHISTNRSMMTGIGAVTVIDKDAIERSGATSVETLLQRMSSSAGFAGNQTNAYWAENGYGTTQVNLRGLGANRTLVLINGRRVVSGGTGANSSVDLNMIPVAMIQRMEVLKDGASAIYGADAVAGVVNLITRKDFNGLELQTRYGQTSRSDSREKAANVAWGISGERGYLMTALDYSQSGTVNMASRAPCGLGEANGKLECVGSSSTIGGRAVLADGTRVNFNQTPGGNGNFYERYNGAKHNFNSNPYLNAVNPIKRISFSTFGNLAINDELRLFTEVLYTNRQSEQLATPGALGVYRPINIAANHPTNPTGQSLLLQRRRLLEAGPRVFSQEVNTARLVLGLEGRLGEHWDWNAAVNYGRNTGVGATSNVANLDRVDQTLNTAVCSKAAGAAIPCGDYLGYGDLTPQVLSYIMGPIRDHGGNEQKSASANLHGKLWQMPAGTVGFATGVEIRKDKGWLDPDQLTVLGISNTNQQTPIAGEYDAKEVFAEAGIPLLANHWLAQSLDFNTAVRYSKYQMFGSNTSYKVGLDWQVAPSFKLRTNYSTAFRIPNIPELYGGNAEGNLTTTDPCSGWSALPASSVLSQNCRAAGVPAGYTQLGNTILTTTGGNSRLQPEKAKTLTAGVVWTPQFARDLVLTLDYFRFRIENSISTVDGSTKLRACYESVGLSHPFCSSAHQTRNRLTGEVDFLSAQPSNAASESMSGIDLGALYTMRVGSTRVTFNGEATYLRNFDVTPFPGGEVLSYAGKITGGRGSFTKWRSFDTLTVVNGVWSGSYSLQYTGKARDINASPGDIGDHAPAVTYHNAQLKYALSKNTSVSFGIDNLWDKKPPFIQSWTDANTDTMTYDLLGRRWYAKLIYRM
ncbi:MULTISPECIES: TonB-dependent receptor domain-containing protein [unclassified Duganella]|uniref:TonB-dependent receptor domain-containing protein n=1 Tax=unclassified Duganella TaxID=2636909 RepID=UPI0008756D9D|nr:MULTISPECIES: TonB-dependent receptor [unclassified Duganella]OEZ53785.1 vitamin B12 transporter BtuB precursor [Duganella sp. HH105]OFA00833.1 vitamin B12 transporter BtuB precursor [Duganella sp. HH101]